MSSYELIGTVSLFLLLMVLNVSATRKVGRCLWMKPRIKRLHYVMIWVIPIFWALLILTIPFDPPDKNRKDDGYRYLSAGGDSYTIAS